MQQLYPSSLDAIAGTGKMLVLIILIYLHKYFWISFNVILSMSIIIRKYIFVYKTFPKFWILSNSRVKFQRLSWTILFLATLVVSKTWQFDI